MLCLGKISGLHMLSCRQEKEEKRCYLMNQFLKMAAADEEWQVKTNRPCRLTIPSVADPQTRLAHDIVEGGNQTLDSGDAALASKYYVKALGMQLRLRPQIWAYPPPCPTTGLSNNQGGSHWTGLASSRPLIRPFVPASHAALSTPL